MEFDFETLPPQDRYRLLCSFVAPRPIALVTTTGQDGRPNAAPMSFFNVFSQDPPILILGIQARPDGMEKETLRNIRRTGEFVVNLCDMQIAQQMVDCGIGFADDVDEVEITGLSHASRKRSRLRGWPNLPLRWSAGYLRSSTTRAGPSCWAKWFRCMCGTIALTRPGGTCGLRSINPSRGSMPTITWCRTGSS